MASTSSAFSDFATFFEKAVALGLRLFWRVCLTLQFLGRSGRERTEACITISCRGIKHVLTCTRKEKQVRHASACPGQSPSPGKLLNCEKQYVFEFENKGTRTATYISAYKTLQKIVQDICIFGTSRTWEACRSFGKFKLCCTSYSSVQSLNRVCVQPSKAAHRPRQRGRKQERKDTDTETQTDMSKRPTLTYEVRTHFPRFGSSGAWLPGRKPISYHKIYWSK